MLGFCIFGESRALSHYSLSDKRTAVMWHDCFLWLLFQLATSDIVFTVSSSHLMLQIGRWDKNRVFLPHSVFQCGKKSHIFLSCVTLQGRHLLKLLHDNWKNIMAKMIRFYFSLSLSFDLTSPSVTLKWTIQDCYSWQYGNLWQSTVGDEWVCFSSMSTLACSTVLSLCPVTLNIHRDVCMTPYEHAQKQSLLNMCRLECAYTLDTSQ